jgi:hypothetical protein
MNNFHTFLKREIRDSRGEGFDVSLGEAPGLVELTPVVDWEQAKDATMVLDVDAAKLVAEAILDGIKDGSFRDDE